MRPIDGDKLLETIEKERQYLRSRGLYGAEHILVHNFRNLVEDAPTVEPERPRGEWNYIQAGIAVCPFCGATPHKQYKNFCPNCGAKMQKGGKE